MCGKPDCTAWFTIYGTLHGVSTLRVRAIALVAILPAALAVQRGAHAALLLLQQQGDEAPLSDGTTSEGVPPTARALSAAEITLSTELVDPWQPAAVRAATVRAPSERSEELVDPWQAKAAAVQRSELIDPWAKQKIQVASPTPVLEPTVALATARAPELMDPWPEALPSTDFELNELINPWSTDR
jgi:hypothetical protein